MFLMPLSRYVAPLLIAATSFVAPALVRADDPATPPATRPAKQDKPENREKGDKEKSDAGKDDKLTVTEHEIKVGGGQTLKYRATAGTMSMKDEAGKAKADFFFIAYEKLPKADDPSGRPVTFVFNGGPGAASVWLHLGTAGPRRVDLTENGEAPPPPYKTVDNEFTWLDATDLVFIDPVNTGFSRPAQGEDPKQFFGLDEDARSVGNFIRLYTTRYERWASPKFLAGESYGTTRAARLSDYLLEAHGIALNGIVFISTVLDFQTIAFGPGNDLPFVTYLPSYTAIAGYHKKLAADLQADPAKAIKEAETFALGDYNAALARGASLPADQRAAVVKELSRLTSLPADVIEKADLRIDPGLFRKRVLGDERKVIGRFDGRISGYDSDPLEKDTGYDPSLPQYLAAYSGAFNDYVRRNLGYQSDLDYEVLSGRVNPWNFGGAGGWNGYPSVAGSLRAAMIKNEHLKLMFCAGLFDLATPYMGRNFTVDHMDISPAMRKNISLKDYQGGHMLYHYRPALDQLHKDIATFIAGAAPTPAAPATQPVKR